MEELRVDLDKACTSLNVEQDVQELANKMLDRCFTSAGETLQTAQVRCVSLSDVSKVKSIFLMWLHSRFACRLTR